MESRDVPQVVGGVAEFTGRGPSAERVRALFAERLPRLPRLTQRVRPGGAFRRPRWVETGTVDLRRHVREVDLPASGGRRALDGLVARLVAEPLDPGRPLWRFWLVRRGSAHPDAVVVLFHYAIADGIGVVDILRGLLDPALPAVGPARGPGRLTRAAAVLPGLVQLGLDGTARTVAVTGTLGPERVFGTATQLDRVRAVARASGVRVTDVLLALVGEVVADVLAERGEPVDGRPLRTAVPMTLRAPSRPAGAAPPCPAT